MDDGTGQEIEHVIHDENVVIPAPNMEKVFSCESCGRSLTKAHELTFDLCWECGPGSTMWQEKYPKYDHLRDYEAAVREVEKERKKKERLELAKMLKEKEKASLAEMVEGVETVSVEGDTLSIEERDRHLAIIGYKYEKLD
jgi:hypothetical protein